MKKKHESGLFFGLIHRFLIKIREYDKVMILLM